IDIEQDGIPVSPYCSRPEQIDTWFKAWHRARRLCGGSGRTRRLPPERETQYLDSLVRGVYAKRDLPAGHVLKTETLDADVYLAIPLQKGQVSCRELISGETLLKPCPRDQPLRIDMIDSPYAHNPTLRERIAQRGL